MAPVAGQPPDPHVPHVPPGTWSRRAEESLVSYRRLGMREIGSGDPAPEIYERARS